MWTAISNTNIYFNPLNGPGQIGINTSSPSYPLDISGNLRVSGNADINYLTVNRVSYVNNISENIVSVAGTDGTTYELNFALGSVFFLTSVPTGLMTVQLYNLPSITDVSRSYVISIIYPGQSGLNYYVKTEFYVNTENTPDKTNNCIPHFTSTPSVSTVNSSNLITQQFIYLYQTINGTSTGYVLSNVSTYTA
jgi:hypothetical protein